MKARSLKTGQIVAIKLIKNVQKDVYYIRKILREIIILRKLSQVENNTFTTKLVDVILSDDYKQSQSLSDLNHLYIVMEFQSNDLKSMIDNVTM